MRGVLVFIVLMAASFAASANTIHQLRFTQPATVIVWQDGVLIGQGDRVALPEYAPNRCADVLGSGVLVPISGGSVGSEQRMRFRIASNSGFSIRAAEAHAISISVISEGENATTDRRMPGETAGVIFQQSKKTAARPGPPESQALTLEATWTAGPRPSLEIVALAP